MSNNKYHKKMLKEKNEKELYALANKAIEDYKNGFDKNNCINTKRYFQHKIQEVCNQFTEKLNKIHS